MEKPKFACVCPPTFTRGILAFGALQYLYYCGLRPELIAGTSGGAMAAISSAVWEKEAMENSWEVWRDLTPGSISRYKLAEGAFAASLAIQPLLHFAPNVYRGENVKPMVLEKSIKAAISFALPAAFLENVFRGPSILSNEPLRKLLESNLDFKKIFSSPVKIITVAADEMDHERVCWTNFLKKDRDRELCLANVLASAAIPAIFEAMSVGGRELVDGVYARGDFLAIDMLRESCNCDYIIIFRFYGKPRQMCPKKDFTDRFDYCNEVIVHIGLAALFESLPQDIKERLIFVDLDEPPKKINLRGFGKEDVGRLLRLGYLAMEKIIVERGWADGYDHLSEKRFSGKE